jgi:hypothetical protein
MIVRFPEFLLRTLPVTIVRSLVVDLIIRIESFGLRI